MTERTLKDIEKEILVLIAEGEALANATNQRFELLDKTFYPASEIIEMTTEDEDEDRWAYLDEWYAKQYGESGAWLSSSDFC